MGVFGLVLFAGTAPGFLSLEDPFTAWSPVALVTRAVFGAAGWCWVVAILGLLDRPRAARPPSRVTVYPGSAALPRYVHQPVVVALAYGVVARPAPIVIKYVVIVAGSPAVLLLLYEFVVRRTRLTRFLFGMRSDSGPRVGPAS
ncbi:hypothetical protein [Streptomyces viridochromogenes]|uniref:Uncharacterized protein n=1 Tax=Streptomyces viridochromogenes Tue57 TaxID=1160705 RepID=L8P2V3_STRVR|nr:hypothetical protein [Streptomyces viridochromogenes]ELS50489.1 hypothetical protein STVIR_8533 [Streptomyces viridochromogenes Tue57]